jgi:CRP-like cAMP-binding protein
MAVANQFVEALSPADREAVLERAVKLTIHRDQLLAETGEKVGYVYLPLNCILSVVIVMRDGRTVESRTIGRESGFGLLYALGSRRSFERVIAQVGGETLRVPADHLTKIAVSSPAAARCIAAHAQATVAQSAISTACNALHGVEPRLCRWLLLTQDRLDADELPLTQEHLSTMLGVQRTTITHVAGDLQARGYISYSRGRVKVLNRKALLGCTCECYEAMNEAAAMALGG